jgi:hypothetical protein
VNTKILAVERGSCRPDGTFIIVAVGSVTGVLIAYTFVHDMVGWTFNC